MSHRSVVSRLPEIDLPEQLGGRYGARPLERVPNSLGSCFLKHAFRLPKLEHMTNRDFQIELIDIAQLRERAPGFGLKLRGRSRIPEKLGQRSTRLRGTHHVRIMVREKPRRLHFFRGRNGWVLEPFGEDEHRK